MEETAKVFIDIELDPYRWIPRNGLSGSRVIMKGMDGISGNKRKTSNMWEDNASIFIRKVRVYQCVTMHHLLLDEPFLSTALSVS